MGLTLDQGRDGLCPSRAWSKYIYMADIKAIFEYINWT